MFHDACCFIQRAGVVIKHGGYVIQRAGVVNQHAGIVIQQAGVVKKQIVSTSSVFYSS